MRRTTGAKWCGAFRGRGCGCGGGEVVVGELHWGMVRWHGLKWFSAPDELIGWGGRGERGELADLLWRRRPEMVAVVS